MRPNAVPMSDPHPHTGGLDSLMHDSRPPCRTVPHFESIASQLGGYHIRPHESRVTLPPPIPVLQEDVISSPDPIPPSKVKGQTGEVSPLSSEAEEQDEGAVSREREATADLSGIWTVIRQTQDSVRDWVVTFLGDGIRPSLPSSLDEIDHCRRARQVSQPDLFLQACDSFCDPQQYGIGRSLAKLHRGRIWTIVYVRSLRARTMRTVSWRKSCPGLRDKTKVLALCGHRENQFLEISFSSLRIEETPHPKEIDFTPH
ncbi:hypothetical protein AAG570_007038 [Ranatra chinensis]|uniref:Uncharacterized protein n=1 Tax=Ranatra chinensis TaxID=642074 RepID=A0ABD0YWF7_9HEMI